jgi:hypothetical protein
MSLRRAARRHVAAVTAALVGERANAEDTPKKRPAERDVGDEDGGRELADVPVKEYEAIRVGEVVVSIEDCGEYHKDT